MDSLYSKISTDLLLQFEAVARHKSLKMAAEELNVSAAAITQSLKLLEKKLEKTLCIRGKNKFYLTEDGHSVYESSKKIKNELDLLSNNMNKEPESYSGLFSIGILNNFSQPRYKDILDEVVRSFPDIFLAIQSMDPDEMVKWIKDGEIDIGFGVFHEKDPNVTYMKIGDEQFTYHVGNKHPLFRKKKMTKRDLYGEKLTWHDSRLRSRAELKNEVFSRQDRYKMDLRAYTNDESAAVDILDSGFAVVPLSQVSPSRKRKDTSIVVKTPELSSFLIYNPNIVPSPVLRHVIDFL